MKDGVLNEASSEEIYGVIMNQEVENEGFVNKACGPKSLSPATPHMAARTVFKAHLE